MAGLEDEVLEVVPDLEEERRGGPQGEDDEDEEQRRKAEERERKKAEVRERLKKEAAEKQGKKAKKGFLTPERKKKLRKLLMLKAAEDLKQQQVKKEQERKEFLAKRIIKLPDVDSINSETELESMAKKFYERMMQLEGEKYDIAVQVSGKDMEINELTIAVCELKGKYVKPTLKKVSKYDNKFKKMLQKDKGDSDYGAFRQNLKKGERKDVMEKLNKKAKENPEWARKKREEAEAEAAAAGKAPRPPKPEEPEKKEEEEAAAEAPAEPEAAPAPAEVAAEA